MGVVDGPGRVDVAVRPVRLIGALGAEPVKRPVRAATVVAGTIDGTAFQAGAAIDDVTLVAGDRILIKDQVTSSQNGIYVVRTASPPLRAGDFDEDWKVGAAVAVAVEEGTVNGRRVFLLAGPNPVEVGTDPLSFIPVAGAAASEIWTPALSCVGGTIQPNLGNGAAAGHFHRIGRRVFFDCLVAFGSTGVTIGTGGFYGISLPVPAVTSRNMVVGSATLVDSSDSLRVYTAAAAVITSGATTVLATLATGGQLAAGTSPVGPTAPFAWATGDSMSLGGSYEAAG